MQYQLPQLCPVSASVRITLNHVSGLRGRMAAVCIHVFTSYYFTHIYIYIYIYIYYVCIYREGRGRVRGGLGWRCRFVNPAEPCHELGP